MNKKKNNLKYKLTVLNEEVDVICLPASYSIRVFSSLKLCNNCYKILNDNDGDIVLIYNYNFHWYYYNQIEYEC